MAITIVLIAISCGPSWLGQNSIFPGGKYLEIIMFCIYICLFYQGTNVHKSNIPLMSGMLLRIWQRKLWRYWFWVTNGRCIPWHCVHFVYIYFNMWSSHKGGMKALWWFNMQCGAFIAKLLGSLTYNHLPLTVILM